MRSPVALFLASALAVIALGVVKAVPALTQERTVIAATPVPDPVSPLEKLKLQRGATLCVDSIPYTPDASRLRLLVPQLDGPPQPLRIRLRARGLDEARRIAPTYQPSSPIVVPFTPVTRSSFGTVCVHNVGRHAVNLGMTSDPRNTSRSQAVLNGKPYGNEIPVTLLERNRASILSRTGDIVGHVAAFKPGLVVALLWPLLILVVVAVPTLVLAAVVAEVRESGDPSHDP